MASSYDSEHSISGSVIEVIDAVFTVNKSIQWCVEISASGPSKTCIESNTLRLSVSCVIVPQNCQPYSSYSIIASWTELYQLSLIRMHLQAEVKPAVVIRHLTTAMAV
jgi:hypothetical protein